MINITVVLLVDYNNYFDNASTSYPKSKLAICEVVRYLSEVGGPYGRGFYQRSIEVGRTVELCRDAVANLLGAKQCGNIVFTNNATQGINIVLAGLELRNKEILISPLEHNAVMRPLMVLTNENRNINYKVLKHSSDGKVSIKELKDQISHKTGLVIINHQSNVNGLIQNIAEIKHEIKDIPILVDAAQSVGYIDINIDKENIDFLAITGHKGLLGPTGIGCLFIRNEKLIPPLVRGGTGSKSESFLMPEEMPDKFEAGTHNIAGIFGLLGAINEKNEKRHTREDFVEFISALRNLSEYTIYGATNLGDQGEVVSIASKNKSVSELGSELYKEFGIETRIGLHCAPLAHKTIGTYPNGTVRISPSKFHYKKDFDRLLDIFVKIR